MQGIKRFVSRVFNIPVEVKINKVPLGFKGLV